MPHRRVAGQRSIQRGAEGSVEASERPDREHDRRGGEEALARGRGDHDPRTQRRPRNPMTRGHIDEPDHAECLQSHHDDQQQVDRMRRSGEELDDDTADQRAETATGRRRGGAGHRTPVRVGLDHRRRQGPKGRSGGKTLNGAADQNRLKRARDREQDQGEHLTSDSCEQNGAPTEMGRQLARATSGPRAPPARTRRMRSSRSAASSATSARSGHTAASAPQRRRGTRPPSSW